MTCSQCERRAATSTPIALCQQCAVGYYTSLLDFVEYRRSTGLYADEIVDWSAVGADDDDGEEPEPAVEPHCENLLEHV